MTDASETTIPALVSTPLEDEFDIVFDGEPRTIVMKFALLRELARMLPGPQDPQLVMQDEILFEHVLVSLLIPRDERGKAAVPTRSVEVDGAPTDVTDWSLDDHDFSAQEAVALVKWAMEHVIGFFLTKFKSLTVMGESQVGEMETLLSSLPGLKGLALKKASAGPTGSNTPNSPDTTGE